MPRPRKFFIGRILTQSQFEIQIIVTDPVSRQPGKTFFGYLQSFSTGTKVRGELRSPTGEKVFKLILIMMLLFMLLFSLRRLVDNAGVIVGLLGILLVAAILEYAARKRKRREEQPFIEYLESTLQAMNLEAG